MPHLSRVTDLRLPLPDTPLPIGACRRCGTSIRFIHVRLCDLCSDVTAGWRRLSPRPRPIQEPSP
jgi:hypothetical protein